MNSRAPNGDAVTYLRVMADFCSANPDGIVNLRVISDHAYLCNTGVFGYRHAGKRERILIVYSVVTALRQNAFAINPATEHTGSDITKINECDDLA